MAAKIVRIRKTIAIIVMRLYSVRILIEKAFLPANLVGALEKRGTTRKACMRRRFGRKVRSDVRGLSPIVIMDSRMLSHSAGGAKNGEADFSERGGGADRQIAI
jgi:hypothetical protein